MLRPGLSIVFAFSFVALSCRHSLPLKQGPQGDARWRISPEKLNVQIAQDRILQALDDSAQELRGVEWAVDDPKLAEIREVGGRAVVHPKATGTLRVSATLGREIRFREIKIWSADQPMPLGTTTWGTHGLGRDLGDIPAVPTDDGPNMYSLEQNPNGDTYLRALGDDGIQIWAWLMPEKTHDVELVCGDWLGGALISANRGDSYTLYVVGKHGSLRWNHTLPGHRMGHAYNLHHLVNILSQSADRTVTKVSGFDGVTGKQQFDLSVPPSHEKWNNLRQTGAKIQCVAQSSSTPLPTLSSHLFVNIDGFAYLAFTQREWVLQSARCTPGSTVEPREVNLSASEQVMLWQIHPDGAYRSTNVKESKISRVFSERTDTVFPTGAIIPDGLGGVLLAIRRSQSPDDVDGRADELVYRMDDSGKLVYEFSLPKNDGPLHDEMVLGENDQGFATRGRLLLAFDVREGRELWRWDAKTTGIEVFAALANGGCTVQTPAALVEVDSATESKEIGKGKAMMDWRGNMYMKHN